MSARPMTLAFYRRDDYGVDRSTGKTRFVPNGKTSWRWTLTAANGATVGASSESYRKRIDAVRNAALVLGGPVRGLNGIVQEVAAGTIPHGTIVRDHGPDIRVVVQ